MTPHDDAYSPGDQVRHPDLGLGTVVLDSGETVIVRFAHGIEECPRAALERVATPLQALQQAQWDRPLEVITRVQAEAITSVNDTWGVLSRSRIALLPHQLWVCKRVLERWPTRWLIADDVGLGKTIEAGLILWPLITRGTVRRVLILCPASLVGHWQYRLRKMFDIRLERYRSGPDTATAEWFTDHHQVVASLHTLRGWVSDKPTGEGKKRPNRLEELLNSPPWDLLIVDEAHHLNYDEDAGPTLGYQLVSELIQRERVQSALFFTGTPHRGKDHAFTALCELLRPDLFSTEEPLVHQLPHLSEMMIRNNKQAATDIEGRRLFTKPKVHDSTYQFSPAEAAFYNMLTQFILQGRAYATELQAREGRAVILVLIAMQKLASSSVAAIRRAIRKRLERIRETREAHDAASRERKKLQDDINEYSEAESNPDQLDRMSQLEERMVALAANLSLMHDEEPRLRELLAAAEQIGEETKVRELLELISSQYGDRRILFFTEYKATQSLLMSALTERFGEGCVTFINGDDAAEDVALPDGRTVTIRETRAAAAERFNAGEVRFLVSTEAGGEGIDLQEQCHTLVHVDLPWNPMRMHQRVGRLNRYGQRHRVEVVIIRNPETVESLVWEKLNEKIERITAAFDSAMEDPEDLLELVLGMTSPALFRDLYSGAAAVERERLSDWVDTGTAQFGGRDVVEVVQGLVGNVARFDFKSVSPRIPRVDLPALRSFVTAMLTLNKRRYQTGADGALSFKTPEPWTGRYGVQSDYDNMIFDREDRSETAEERILGVGHPVVDEAIKQATAGTSCVAVAPREDLAEPLIVFRISDRVTTGGGPVRSVIAGVAREADGRWELVEDWRLLQRMNALADRQRIRAAEGAPCPEEPSAVAAQVAQAETVVRDQLDDLDLPFTVPEPMVLGVLWPDA